MSRRKNAIMRETSKQRRIKVNSAGRMKYIGAAYFFFLVHTIRQKKKIDAASIIYTLIA